MKVENIKIAGKLYRINEQPGPFVHDGVAVDGAIDFGDCAIYLNTYGDAQYVQETLLHEIVHGIIREYSICLEEEERFVQAFTKGLYQVLKDNKKIIV